MSEAQRSPDADIALHTKLMQVKHLLPEGSDIRLSLGHQDIHAPNMFVQKECVASFVDWQNTRIGPLFLKARRPW